MTQDLNNMSLGAGDDDRDDLDFSGAGSQFLSGFQVDLQNSSNNRFSSHHDNSTLDSSQKTVIPNFEDRPIGGSGSRVDADPYATGNSYQAYDERPIGGNASG